MDESQQPGSAGESEQRKALANERATDLLLENLTAEQCRQYVTYRFFEVIGGESGRRYRIWQSTSDNIEEFDDLGRRICTLCVRPLGVAIADMLLAQKMALELFESDTLRIAQRYWDYALIRERALKWGSLNWLGCHNPPS